MNRTNRIQPACANNPPVKYAVMTITTQMEILKHVEVTPSVIRTMFFDYNSNIQSSFWICRRRTSFHNQQTFNLKQLSKDFDLSIRIQLKINFHFRQARKILSIITCLFITAAIITLVIFLICVIITFAS